ncbi:MAG TPA: TetR/AcrR family transcriptional regulator [Acidimicrobiales bacterium]|nr:TetR/AcrR family transcriptional regulator [Acidimicrobiales bacterium]
MTAAPGEATVERRPGRPRDARADEAIIQASVEVLADKGPAGFTVDEVAARAGCGKATIYRRWSSRASLLLETAHRMGLEPAIVDTGSVRDDLVALMAQFGTKLKDTPAGRILPGVVAEAAVNPEMRQVLSRFVRDRRDRPRQAIVRGVERGELPPDTDVELLLDILGGSVFYRVLVTGERGDEAFATRLVDLVLSSLT